MSGMTHKSELCNDEYILPTLVLNRYLQSIILDQPLKENNSAFGLSLIVLRELKKNNIST